MHGLAKDTVLSLKLAGNSRSGTSWQAVHASRFPCASPSGKAEGSADYKLLEASLLGSVLGQAQFHLIPTASKKLVDAPFQSLVHILQQPSCNYETLLTSSALDVEFFFS